jgi:hypothetical protein
MHFVWIRTNSDCFPLWQELIEIFFTNGMERVWYIIRFNVWVENELWSVGPDSAVSGERRITGAFTMGLLVFRITKTKQNYSITIMQYLCRIINIILLAQFGEMNVNTVLFFLHLHLNWVRLNEIKACVKQIFVFRWLCGRAALNCEVTYCNRQSALYCSLYCCSCSLLNCLCSIECS